MLKKEKNIRFLSRMGARGVLGEVLFDMACEEKEFYTLSADLEKAAGYDRLVRNFPERCVNTGIAEQSMMGAAAGLSQTGIPVYVASWAVFTSLRVADQIRNYMGSMRCNLKLIGMDSGLTKADFGLSHTNPQDIAFFRSQPNVRIIAPSDGQSIYQLLTKIQQDTTPTYVRLTGGEKLPIIYKETVEFSLKHSMRVQRGTDVAILSTGVILQEVLQATERLEAEGISVEVIDCHMIKPFDYEILEEQMEKKLIVTVEEHSMYAGLGGIVAEHLAMKQKHPPLMIFGIRDEVVQSQTYEEALFEYRLTAEQIYQRVLEAFKNMK
jgi:transketolase